MKTKCYFAAAKWKVIWSWSYEVKTLTVLLLRVNFPNENKILEK